MGELGGQAGADLHEELLAERLPYGLRVLGLADHIDDVDVGDVVELVCPGLAHGDHGKGHLVRLRSDSGTGDEQGCVQGGVGELRHTVADGRDVLDRVCAGEVIGDDCRETVPISAPQRGSRPVDGRAGTVRDPSITIAA